MTEKIELLGLSKTELAGQVAALGEKPFRAKQLWQWLYYNGVTDFAQMSSLSKELRAKLAENFTITRPKIVAEQVSVDKTHKWLLEFADGQRVEMVYIPEEDRGAVCISTQVGCAMGCRFCHTGSQKLTRNLTAGEIVGQFMVARDVYGEWPTRTDENRMLSNIVVMGMGEPLQNVENVIKAMNIITDGEGIAVSRRRITLSTSGIAPRIVEVAEATGVRCVGADKRQIVRNRLRRVQIRHFRHIFRLTVFIRVCQRLILGKAVRSRELVRQRQLVGNTSVNAEKIGVVRELRQFIGLQSHVLRMQVSGRRHADDGNAQSQTQKLFQITKHRLLPHIPKF